MPAEFSTNDFEDFGDISVSAGYDSASVTFFTAAGITDGTQKTAVNTLVLALKAAGVWSKCYAIYPFVGGTAATHKFNLKDSRDLNAAYRITWSGTVTHNANGVTGNAADGSGDTNLQSSAVLTAANHGLTAYIRNNSSTNAAIANATTVGGFSGLIPRSGASYFAYMADVSGATIANANSQGMWTAVRPNATDINNYKNGAAFGSNPALVGVGTLSTSNIIVLGGNAAYSDFNLAFAAIHQSLSSTEAANFYTAVQAFQTTLSRQV